MSVVIDTIYKPAWNSKTVDTTMLYPSALICFHIQLKTLCASMPPKVSNSENPLISRVFRIILFSPWQKNYVFDVQETNHLNKHWFCQLIKYQKKILKTNNIEWLKNILNICIPQYDCSCWYFRQMPIISDSKSFKSCVHWPKEISNCLCCDIWKNGLRIYYERR